MLFLNIGTEQLGIEMENNIIYHIKNVKYFGMHLIKYVWDLYTENYKILLREVKADLNKSRDRLYIHGLENSILLRCPFSPSWYTDLLQSPIIIQAGFLPKQTNCFYYLNGNAKDLEQSKQFWNKIGRSILSDLESYCKPVAIKMVWYWHGCT